MRVRCGLATLLLFVLSGLAHADEPTFTSADVAELIRRLEQAEAKIQQLENQLNGNGSQPTSTTQNEESDAGEKSQKPEQSIEDRLKSLEEDYKADKEAQAKEKEKKPNLKISGRIHMDYWGHPYSDPGINATEREDPTLTPQERFLIRRLRVAMEGNISDTVIYKLESEFGDPNDFQFRDLYIGFTDVPFFQTIQIGNQKRPLGFDTWNSSRYSLFLERPMVIDAFNEDARRIGIQAFGVSKSQNVNWQYGVFFLEKMQDDGEYRDDHLQLSFNGRLAGTPWYDESSGGRGYLHLAMATMIAHTDGDSPNEGTTFNQAEFFSRPSARTSEYWLDTGRIDEAEYYEVVGIESLLNIGAFSITSEYQSTWLQRDAGLTDLHFHGGYVQLAYWLTGEHTPIDRTSGALDRTQPFEEFFLVKRCTGGVGGGWGAWQILWRTQYVDLTADDILGGKGYSTTVGFNWWFNAHSRLQFNYILGRLTDRAQLDTGLSRGGNYSIYGARLMVDF